MFSNEPLLFQITSYFESYKTLIALELGTAILLVCVYPLFISIPKSSLVDEYNSVETYI